MQTIYLDNASTSWPKAPGAGRAMLEYMDHVGVNVARGGYSAAIEAGRHTLRLRESLCALFHSPCVEGCILTPGATYGLNMVLKSYLRPGDRVLVSGMEHNAVMRPLRQIEGLEIAVAPCRSDGTLELETFSALLTPGTRMVCMTHASNLCGTVLPIQAVGALCRERGVAFVVDASQTVGHLPIDCQAWGISGLLFSAHKGLLGPQGIGAALLQRDFAQALTPFVTGGTGSLSERETQPPFLPDKLEAGTPNLPGIYGFQAALDFLAPRMVEIAQKENALTARFAAGLAAIQGIAAPGLPTEKGRVGVFSVDFIEKDNAEVAAQLESRFGLCTRTGLHCAPLAHRTLGTFPQGTVRFSLGWATTEEQVDTALEAIRQAAATA